MNGIDPAWFYSSLAQASAAIVGLMGAILGSRIIDHISLMRAERSDLDRKIWANRKNSESRINDLNKYKGYLLQEIEKDKIAISEGKQTRSITNEIVWTRTSIGRNFNITEHLSESEKNLKILECALQVYSSFSGEIRELDITLNVDRLKECTRNLPKGIVGIDIFNNDAESLQILLQLIPRFRLKLFPKSFIIVFLLLGWLSITGIIWPLTALPGLAKGYHPQSLMLIALGLGLFGLMGYFVYQMCELIRLGRLRWPYHLE